MNRKRHSADLLRGKPVYRLRYFIKLFIKLIRRKIIKIVAIRCYVLKLECTSASRDPLAGFNGSYFLGKGGQDGGEETSRKG